MSWAAGAIDPRTSHTMWLVLYLLVIIWAPVQHAIAVAAAGASPVLVRSRLHAFLNIAALAGTVPLFGAALVWHAWLYLIVVPAGFVIGLRNMLYASRRAATPSEQRREYWTSILTAVVVAAAGLFLILHSKF